MGNHAGTARSFISPARDRARQRKRVLLWSATALPLLLISAARSNSDDILLWLFLGAISFGIFSVPKARQSGYKGEESVVGHLVRRLGQDYVVLNQVEVPNPRSRTGKTEIDLVVIGPTGIYNLEVKNHKGEVFGNDEHAALWPVRKIGRTGTVYKGTMRNPIRQALSQALTLKNYLAQFGVNLWVTPVVVMSYPESVWHVGQSRGVPVIRPEEAPVQCGIARESGPRLSPELVAAIASALSTLKSRR